MSIRDQVAIVTGASSGIGAALARSLAAKGVHVVLAARRTDRIDALAIELAQQFGVRTLAIATDVSKRAEIEALVARAIVEFQRIDILVNNAGLGLQGDVADLAEDRLRYLFDVNVFGLVNAMQAVLPYMRRQGSGVIVNVSSILGKVVVPSLGMVGSSAGYTASKFAVQAFSAAARMELAAQGIAVVTVLPGITESEFNTNFMVSDANGVRKVRKTGSLAGVKPAAAVADRIVLAIERREREVLFSWKDRLFIWGAHHFPGLFEWAMIRFRASRIGE
ncbi:MAG: SDR family NAD(P)-dependent oxidoreductase [Anaerolineales bacterium]|nr:SDR family NAD(P)-dependent oxidoreductase [Anaerolineales bacterium]